MAKHHISMTLNGEPTEFLCSTRQTLLDVLRDELNLTGSKEGCASGDCGACSVMVDDRLVCACLVLGAECDGKLLNQLKEWLTAKISILFNKSFWKKQHYSAAYVHRAY